MVKDALQINATKDDYHYYKKWTKNIRHRQLGFMFALFKVRNNAHVQVAGTGEFGQGKTSSIWSIAKWETIYIKRLLRIRNKRAKVIREAQAMRDFFNQIGNHTQAMEVIVPAEVAIETDEKIIEGIHFEVKDNIVISPSDPASKNLFDPKKLNSYMIDDAEFFTSTAEANTKLTKKIRKKIAGNRKQNPSNYWIFPNLFKIPTSILETMDVWIHKESQRVGNVIIPSRVIQIKEKFDKERVEKYAKYPKFFPSLITHHPSFVMKVRFPAIKGARWIAYEAKYDKYKWDDEEGNTKESTKITFFKELEKVIEKDLTMISSSREREDLIYKLIYNTLIKKTKNESTAQQISESFKNQFIKWQEEKFTSDLARNLSGSTLSSVKLDIDMGDEVEKEDAIENN